MPILEKAKLAILDNTGGAKSRTHPRVVEGSEVAVQFNPASLRLTLRNVHDRGENKGRQIRQFMGVSSDVYKLELHFDSADDGEDGDPVSVRRKTQIVERYLKPGAKNATPPRLRFTWGDFIIDGVVESLDLEFDHFAANGIPLRAKATLSLKEQDSTYEVVPLPTQEAGRTTKHPNDAGTGAPGSGGSRGSRSAISYGGESPAELATRLGLDPSTWRGLEFNLDEDLAGTGLTLAAGASVNFDLALGATTALGTHVGFEAGASASLAASFGLSADVTVDAGATASFSTSASAIVSAERSAGFRLAASGGVEAALELRAGFEASAVLAGAVAAFADGAPPSVSYCAVDLGTSTRAGLRGGSRFATRSSFAGAREGRRGSSAVPRAALPSGPSRPPQDRTPLSAVVHRLGTHVEHAPAPPPPRVDRRAITYGRGVPLRPQVRVSDATRPSERDECTTPPTTRQPTVPPWIVLPAADRLRSERSEREAEGDCSCRSRPEVTWSIEQARRARQKEPR